MPTQKAKYRNTMPKTVPCEPGNVWTVPQFLKMVNQFVSDEIDCRRQMRMKPPDDGEVRHLKSSTLVNINLQCFPAGNA